MCKGIPGEKGDPGIPGIGLTGLTGQPVIIRLNLIRFTLKLDTTEI